MSDSKNIPDELKSLESGLPVTNSPAFSVPEGYFEGLAERLLAKVKTVNDSSLQAELESLSPLLANAPKTTPYAVPSGYFEANVDAGVIIFGQEINSSILGAAGKTLPYSVPAGYFETFPEKMLAKLVEPKAKVVPLFARTWMRVAAAAMLAAAFVLGGIQLFDAKPADTAIGANTPTNTALVAQNRQAIKQEIEKVPTNDLEQFMENVVPVIVQSTPGKEKALEEKEAGALLKDVSVNEMESFLAVLPSDDDEIGGTD